MKKLSIGLILLFLCGCTSYGPWQEYEKIKLDNGGEYTFYRRSQTPYFIVPMIVAIPDQNGVQYYDERIVPVSGFGWTN